MSKMQLEDIIKEAQKVFMDITDEISKSGLGMTTECERIKSKLTLYSNILGTAFTLIEHRNESRTLIDNVLSKADRSKSIVNLCGREIPFSHARLISFQAYLCSTWSVADLICNVVGRLIFPQNKARDETQFFRLLQHFMNDDKSANDYTKTLLSKFYGWPIAFGYAVRNYFIHEGAIGIVNDFFEGQDPINEFKVSNEGISIIEDKVKNEYKADPSHALKPEIWPTSRNLLELLDFCHQELDSALCILLKTACEMTRIQVGLILDR